MKKDCVVILPKNDSDFFEKFKYTLGKVILVDGESNVTEIVNSIKEKTVYLVNFDDIYRKLLLLFDKDVKLNAIITHPIASFTNIWILNIFQNIMEFYDRGLYNCIYTLEKSLYELLNKKNYSAKMLKLDTNITYNNKKPENSVGIMSKDYIPNHNFYNALSGAKKSGIKLVKLESSMYETKEFAKVFDINVKYCENEYDTYSNNLVNIYPTFTDSIFTKTLESFDTGIPCLLGNCDMFENYKILKEYCVLISDDDIEEIATKINQIIINKDKILKEYKEFRTNYKKLGDYENI